jgi:hypothetical protein
MAAHFHVEDRGERGIYLRSISESAHNWVSAVPSLNGRSSTIFSATLRVMA